jgi:hypothetical protein
MELKAFLADLVVFFHGLYVLFAVGGEAVILIGAALRWRWIRNLWFRVLHLGAVLLVAAQALLGVLCPLTILENRLRTAAGQTAEEEITFLGRIIRHLIFYDFPGWVFTLLYVGFGAVVLGTLFLVPPEKPPGRRQP